MVQNLHKHLVDWTGFSPFRSVVSISTRWGYLKVLYQQIRISNGTLDSDLTLLKSWSRTSRGKFINCILLLEIVVLIVDSKIKLQGLGKPKNNKELRKEAWVGLVFKEALRILSIS